ncbi:MAG: sigma-70 family RNA polymerase sigma factor [Pirellulales bacterium]
MSLSESTVIQTLMQRRAQVSAAAWLVVRDAHAAEDIFQNVVLKAMTRDVSFESEGALLSWAFITARRAGIDWVRRQGRESRCLPTEILELIDQEWIAQPAMSAGGRLEALKQCLEAAPEVSRLMVRLRYFEGCTCEEVAQRLGIGLDAIYKRFSRLHESLQQCVENRLREQGTVGA